MGTLFKELKRRNVFRVAAAYLVLAWLVLQVTDLVAPPLGLPEWTMSMVIFLGFVGFPFALLFAWAFELTPDGIRRSEDVEPTESIAPHTGTRLNQVTSALLLAAVVILLLDRQLGWSQKWRDDHAPAGADVPTAVAPAEAMPSQAENTSPERSIAVLPFVNMSDDPSQEYFSDGISEELLNGLAKIRELRVAARTSSFAFKGKNQDISDIAAKLKVATVLEGSVRKSGQRVRITAQLINAADGYHLWSETYDRDLTDIFAVQDEISAAIVEALKVHLTDGSDIEKTRAVDLEAYNLVLQARHHVRKRTRQDLELAASQYRQALDIDEDYAAAWAGLAIATTLLRQSQYGDIPDETSYTMAQGYLDSAFAIDPSLAEAQAGQALVYLGRGDFEPGLEFVDLALQSMPNNGDLYLWKSHMLAWSGNYLASVATLDKAFEVDPLHPSIIVGWSERMARAGRGEELLAQLADKSLAWYRARWFIARAEGRWADQFSITEEAIAQDGHIEPLLRTQQYTRYYELYDPEPRQDALSQIDRDSYRAASQPEAFAQAFATTSYYALDRQQRNLIALAYLQLDQCERVVELMAPSRLESLQRFGLVSRFPGEFGDADEATQLAWCLRRIGEVERAEQLAGRLLSEQQQALSMGMPVYYLGMPLIGLMLAAGDEHAALDLLDNLVSMRQLYFREIYEKPYLRQLDGNPRLAALKARLLADVNEERARLGWPAVEDTGI